MTYVKVDADLLMNAKLALGVRTNREAIDVAPRDVVMRQRQLDAIDALAAMDLDFAESK